MLAHSSLRERPWMGNRDMVQDELITLCLSRARSTCGTEYHGGCTNMMKLMRAVRYAPRGMSTGVAPKRDAAVVVVGN
jgi:hypothetical protein